jgi:uroporphyrin-III C-methyltransferase
VRRAAPGPLGPPAPGWVSLVGAGPGDPGLITRRGLDRIRGATAVLHDRLVAPELVADAPAAAAKLFVGKGGEHGNGWDQDRIHEEMIGRARAGEAVVRLKGGDPFVFGRGGEEALALAAAGVPFEVIPGISSCIAAPAAAGIPVTHRGLSGSFAVVTARRRDGSAPPWAALAHAADPGVRWRGGAGLAAAADARARAGRDPQQPAAAVEWATTPRQRTIIATLGTLAPTCVAAGMGAPATIVVGEVAALGARAVAPFAEMAASA